MGEVVAKLVAVYGLTFNQIAGSKSLRRTFAADVHSLPSSRDYLKKVFMKQFAEIVTTIREIKETNNRFSISFDESTTTRNRRFINLNLHFLVGFQSLGLIRVKVSLRTERAIDLVQERLNEYALSINDDIVSTITNGASIMMKFGHETEPLHISCLAHVIHLSVCDALYTEKPKQISDECRDDGGTGNTTVSDESDGEENLKEKSDEHGSDEEQQNLGRLKFLALV